MTRAIFYILVLANAGLLLWQATASAPQRASLPAPDPNVEKLLLLRETQPSSGAEQSATVAIVVNGVTEQGVADAMRAGISAACARGDAGGVQRISAGNFGGKLGQYHFRLHEVMA